MARTKKHSDPVKRWMSPGGKEYTHEDVERIRNAARHIMESFDWDDTKEGREHWSPIVDRLEELANEIENRINNGYDDRL